MFLFLGNSILDINNHAKDKYFQIRTTKMLPGILYFLFLKHIFGIWEGGFTNSFLGSFDHNLVYEEMYD
jgi:hypothetical protein